MKLEQLIFKHVHFSYPSASISAILNAHRYHSQSHSHPCKDYWIDISAVMLALTWLIFCKPLPPRTIHRIGPRINDGPHVRWSSDRSRSAIDGLDLGQDDAESAGRVLSCAFMAFGRQESRQAGRDCRSEIEVVPLAVNLWNAATGRAIRSIIRFELRPSNCARVIRAAWLLLPSRYIPRPRGKLQSIGSSFMITAGRHPAVTFSTPPTPPTTISCSLNSAIRILFHVFNPKTRGKLHPNW